MEKNKVLDVIISLLEGVKNKECLSDYYENDILEIKGCKYLLNQTIRQYILPSNHYFVSEKAFALWSEISTDNIFNYAYNDKVKKDTDNFVKIDKYRGGENTPRERDVPLAKGAFFQFNDVFSDEHIVTVNNIIAALLALREYTYEAVKNILDKIYICKMLKSEDRSIKNKKNRSLDYREVIVFDYKNVGVIIKDFDYEKTLEDLKTERPNIEDKTGSSSPPPNPQNTKIGEYFTIKNQKEIFRNKRGFLAFNSENKKVGIVFMTDDKRTPAYQHCELAFFNKYKGKEWCRFTSNGFRIKWGDLYNKLATSEEVKIFID